MTDGPGQALRERHAAVLAAGSLTGGALREALGEVVDRWVGEVLPDVAGVAVVAVGSLGRRELSPASDLDLVLLHDGGRDVARLADAIWYPIWDAGLRLDHSVRIVEEALAVAADDLKAALGLLDLRYIAGDPAPAARLRERVYETWRRTARTRLPEVVAAVRERGERDGELAFLLEPDLKESRGGLRDVHALHAFAAAQVTDLPGERVRAAYQLLLDVRGELHRRTGRSHDVLVAQEHAPVAAAVGLDTPDRLQRALSDAGRIIAFATDQACRRVEAATRPRRAWRRSHPVRRPLTDNVVEQGGEVHLAVGAQPGADPVLALRAAAAAAQNGLPLGQHTVERLAAESAPLPVPWPAAARDALVSLLGAGRAAVAVIEAVDQADLLVRWLPEWEQVRCRPQHNPVHRFTVDRHLVEAAVEAAALTRRVDRPDLLLVAALLHDIGKGWPGDHTALGVELVPGMLDRMGYPAADIALVTRLVAHHLLLPDTATRRDLADPQTAALVAEAVGDRRTLDLLHALTEADALATGPAAWTDWKARLVGELVERTAAQLSGEPTPSAPEPGPAVTAMVDTGTLGVEVTGTRITVVCPDRTGLLALWAGVAAVHRVSVRAAAVSTQRSSDGTRMAVTVLDVEPRFGAMPSVEDLVRDMRAAAEGRFLLVERLAERERAYQVSTHAPATPPRVVWDDEASQSSSVVEVRAHDRLGLLVALTSALTAAGLDVQTARIATLGAEVVDAFYVVDGSGAAVEPGARREQVTAALLAACR